VNFYKTIQGHIPEDSTLHSSVTENLKSYRHVDLYIYLCTKICVSSNGSVYYYQHQLYSPGWALACSGVYITSSKIYQYYMLTHGSINLTLNTPDSSTVYSKIKLQITFYVQAYEVSAT
jgi:hypothetical protein